MRTKFSEILLSPICAIVLFLCSKNHETEIPMIHQQITTESSSILEPPDSSSTRPHSMLSYPRSWLNTDEPLTTSTIENGLKITDKGDVLTVLMLYF